MWSHRNPSWEHWLLDDTDARVDRIDGVTGGSVTLQGLTRLGGHGTLELDDRGQQIDWMRHRVQSIYDPGTGVEPWPVSTFMLSSPVTKVTALGRSYSVGLLPKTQILDEDAYAEGFSLPAGANIIDAVVAVIRSAGEQSISVTPSEAVLANPQAWDADVPKLTIANELLESAGYWSLWCDGAGQFRVEPYEDPAVRAISYEFVEGEASLHMPEWEHSQDHASVPNRFIVVGQGDDAAPPLVGVAENRNPESAYSFQARGRWITRTETGVEGADQKIFDQLAARRLTAAMAPVEHVQATHAVLPLSPNEAILFDDSGYRQRLTIQNMTIPFTFDADVSAEWRRTGA